MSRRIEAAFGDDEVYSPSESAKGNNAYYFRCEEVQHSTPYCVCLKHIADRKNGRLDSIYSTCSAAIGRKDCPALAMQAREKEAGKAIYFVNRRKMREFYAEEGESLDLVPQEKWTPPSNRKFASSSKASPAPKPSIKTQAQAPTPKPTNNFSQENIYAEAINAALETKKTEAPSDHKNAIMGKSVVTQSAGLSPLALARLMAQQGKQ